MTRTDDLAARNEEFWKHALDRAKLGVWDWNLQTNECFYSATWAQMLGYDLSELPSASDLWLQLTHPDDRERAIASGERHLAGLTEIIETEIRFRHKNGEWLWVLDRGGVVERTADGRPLRMIGVQTDISRQKAGEAELAKVNARFRLAIAASGTGIWHHDVGSPTSFWDERTKEIYGASIYLAEVPGDLWHTFLHPDDRMEAERSHEAVIGSPEVSAVRYRIVREDGEIRHIESLLRYISSLEAPGQLLGTVRDITDEVNRESALAHAARHDPLTGLLNRKALDELLTTHIGSIDKCPLALFYIDLDYFKALNDFAGHAAGDAALRGIASSIRKCAPAGAVVARLGGDEFVVLFPDCADIETAEGMADDLLVAVRTFDVGGAGAQRLAASIGVVLLHDRNVTPADALACADDACYAAKATGRNRVSVFSNQTTFSTSGLNAARMASDTMDSLEEGRLHLFGQKIHALDGRDIDEVCHAEVLARLIGRNGQTISPAEFIPAAERFGIAPQLDRWIIRTALTRFRHAMTTGRLVLSFNLSAQTLSDPHLWTFVDSTIEETGVPHSSIGFEITETAAVTSFEAAERFIRSARDRCCRVSLDDFGAGLSSFNYLRRFPVDIIKIDGSFVKHMATDKFDRQIVASINGIAKSVGYDVVAEKIEDQAALDILTEMGVQFGQGYLLHRPEPLEQMLASTFAPVSRVCAPPTGY